jgi:hypothetical protein
MKKKKTIHHGNMKARKTNKTALPQTKYLPRKKIPIK